MNPTLLDLIRALVDIVFRVFEGKLVPPHGPLATVYRPLVLAFPEELSREAWAQRVFEELSLTTPCECWQNTLSPALAEQLHADETAWLEVENGFPRITGVAGQLTAALRQRYDNCRVSHRWFARDPELSEEDFIKKAVCGTASLDDPAVIEEQLAEPAAAHYYAARVETIVRGNFAGGVFASLLRQELPLGIALRSGNAAQLVCPICAHEFISYGEDCPGCGRLIADLWNSFRVAVVKNYWFIEDAEPLFIPGYVWECTHCKLPRASPRGKEREAYFPLPLQLGSQAPPPPKGARCPECGNGHRQNPKRLFFYVEPLPPPGPPLGMSGGANPLSAPGSELAGICAEMIDRGVPGWAINTHITRALAETAGPRVLDRLCPAGGAAFDYEFLFRCLLAPSPMIRMKILTGAALSPKESDSLATSIRANELKSEDRVPAAPVLRKEWEGCWRAKIEEYLK